MTFGSRLPRRGALTAAATAAAAAALLLAPTSASATSGHTAPVTAEKKAPPRPAATCFINGNNVNYRTGPGVNYTSRGQVHKGQGFDITGGRWGDNPADGIWWNEGTFWGGDGNRYWVRRDFMNC
ncbi:hypothetical protein [Streptomyces sp. NPDC059788]|uniref:hypothetical protein n=1 Tax=Streptomyces sp. NPDC059788 TaxID=3346948 RepID=UPI00365DE029